MTQSDQLKAIAAKVEYIQALTDHNHRVLHQVLDLVQFVVLDGTAEDKVRLVEMTKSLKQTAADLTKATADNPVPKS
ncbi:MAG: hypothetical protein V4532_06100 [Pseudomonadota bacterium]